MVVLLVEDDPGDRKLVMNALYQREVACDIKIATTGEEALEYLAHSSANQAESPRPDIILLDLNMPGMGGKEFLKQIKTDDDLCSIPVIVLTTSDSENDIEECYRLQASGYAQKPTSPAQFQKTVHNFVQYWFRTALLAKN